ncbi:neuroligin-4, X-linked-like isoform X1 [Limulus polyphemus]|uniref:Neuroligin-4, X-linked-like isoform X1 n=1 Tax=Limulus polyphemus TaxID=6850 RepID=A0ABM1BDQ5_LIMPO|nr:neuroligin-4, X-linked-like isoform X1 [Limulus polyphemus]
MCNKQVQRDPLRYFIFLGIFICLQQVHEATDRLSSRVVMTKYGSLRGIIRDLANKDLRPVEVFYGVPYASAPIGSLRFMPPVTPPHWRKIRIASRFGPVCPQKFPDIQNQTEALKRMPPGRLTYLRQILPFLDKQSEDCLYLNIYAPAILLHQSAKVPVIVFIQGESYEWNSGNPYDGSVIASMANVIVITLNFRLGVLGFLPALEGASRGNYGLMDQVAALHWIQENIVEFGGDINNVTIMGHGHGAAFVNLLMVSPMARGLFHRSIMQSGSALSPWAIARQAPEFTRQLANKLSCPTVSNVVMVDCLRNRPTESILNVELIVADYLPSFGPVVDGIVIPNEPEILMRDYNNLYNQYDLLLGVSRMEFYFKFSANEERYGIEEGRRTKLFQTLVTNVYTYHLQEIFYVIENEYTDWERANQHPINTLENTADAMGDGLVVGPLLKATEYRAKGSKKTFLFVFGHQTEESEFPKRFGCIHGEDLPYVFGAPLVGNLAHFQQNFSRSEVSLAETVLTYWTSFAKRGDPNALHFEDEVVDRVSGRFERVEWPAFDNVLQKYISLGAKPKIRDHYRAHQLSFWNNLIPKIHRSGTGVYPHHSFLGNPHSQDGVLSSDLLPTTADDNIYSTEVSSIPTTLNHFGTSSGPSSTPLAETTPGVLLNHSTGTTQPSEQSTYSTALSVTIAVGCSLLILNVLIFTGMFYQKDKNKLEAKLQKNNHKMKVAQENDNIAGIQRKQVSRVPPLSPSSQELPPPPPAPSPTPPKAPPKSVYSPQEEKPMPEAQPLLHHGCQRVAPPARASTEEMRV